MNKNIIGKPLKLWNAGNLLDYLDECIHNSQTSASGLTYANDNIDNKTDNVFTTPDFENILMKWTKGQGTETLCGLKKHLKKLLCLNDSEKPKGLKQVHVSFVVCMKYRFGGDNTLVVDLMFDEVTINHIDSIIYFDDYEDLERFNPGKLARFDDLEMAKNVNSKYEAREQWTSLEISSDEIRHVFSLINACQDFYRYPSAKSRTFPAFIRRYGITINQTNIEIVLQSLQTEVLCKCICSTDNEYWRRTFLKYEFYNNGLKFSNGRSVSKFGLPLVIYIVIAENLRANDTVALVSFTSHDFERCMLAWNPAKQVDLNYVEKIGSAYIVSVVARPYFAEDPFFEFYISETSYNKIIHLIEVLNIRHQMKYPMQRRCDAYKSHVLYRSMDPLKHGLPIPVKYFFC